jgi:Glycogen recognition site of AMP-activated protein kinase
VEQRPKGASPTAVPPPSGPMDVPSNSKGKHDDFEDHAEYNQGRYGPVSLLRPPRLPLPIADVIPESPTLLPVDRGNEDVSIMEVEDQISATEPTLHRRDSMLSTSTLEEDEIRDELQPYAVETSGQAVPTVINWNQSGEKVYVTGTFANWEKKFKLHRR